MSQMRLSGELMSPSWAPRSSRIFQTLCKTIIKAKQQHLSDSLSEFLLQITQTQLITKSFTYCHGTVKVWLCEVCFLMGVISRHTPLELQQYDVEHSVFIMVTGNNQGIHPSIYLSIFQNHLFLLSLQHLCFHVVKGKEKRFWHICPWTFCHTHPL